MPVVSSTSSRRRSLSLTSSKKPLRKRRHSYAMGEVKSVTLWSWRPRWLACKHPPLPEGLDWTITKREPLRLTLKKTRPRILRVESLAQVFSRRASAIFRTKRLAQNRRKDHGLVGTARRLVLRAKCFRMVTQRIVPSALDVQDHPAWAILRAEYCWSISCLYPGVEGRNYRVLSDDEILAIRHDLKSCRVTLEPPSKANPVWSQALRRPGWWDCFFCASKMRDLEALKAHIEGQHQKMSFPSSCLHCG
jgi:hypothetical protein